MTDIAMLSDAELEEPKITDEMYRAYKGAMHKLINSVPTIGERMRRWRQTSPNGYRVKEREKATARYYAVRAVDPEFAAMARRTREAEAELAEPVSRTKGIMTKRSAEYTRGYQAGLRLAIREEKRANAAEATIAQLREQVATLRETIDFVAPALPVLRNMLSHANLSKGVAKADEMIAALAATSPEPSEGESAPVKQAADLCDDCPPAGYPTDKMRCLPCPRRKSAPDQGRRG